MTVLMPRTRSEFVVSSCQARHCLTTLRAAPAPVPLEPHQFAVAFGHPLPRTSPAPFSINPGREHLHYVSIRAGLSMRSARIRPPPTYIPASGQWAAACSSGVISTILFQLPSGRR